ncbi:LysR family transcriptional regulator [Paucibacter soli]|uniref:LysR family transcriptional regulator n=1 Tax=Paucibacter soli TaxID=3133433 RepID=UPI0030B0D9DC
MKQSELDLNAIKVLVAVVHAGSFSAAARRMGVPPNRLSRQIQGLEESLGLRLLQRSTRRLSLTTVGRTLLDRAEPAVQELEALWREAGAQAELPSGHLRVAAPADFMSVLAADRLARFLDLHPQLSLEIILSDEPVDLFGSGIDMAFRAGPIRDESLVARKLVSSKLVLVASPACVKAHGLPKDAKALAAYPCLVSRGREGRAVWTLRGPRGTVAVPVHARLSINGMGALVAAAMAGLGAALVPKQLADAAIAAGSLVRLLPRHDHDGGGIFAVYPSRRHPPAALRALIDFVVQEARAAPPEA